MEKNHSELVKKFKALADRGIGGEKENAESMLKKYLKKHNLTLEDVEIEEKDYKIFNVKKDQARLFYKIVASVLGSHYDSWKGMKPNTKMLFITNSEFIEIDIRYSHYWNEWVSEAQIFYEAFIQKNHLYSNSGKSTLIGEQTPEEKARLLRVLEMASNIKNKTIHKQLTRG